MTFEQIRNMVQRSQCTGTKIKALKFTEHELRQFSSVATVSYLPSTGDLYWLDVPLTQKDLTPFKHA